MKHYKYYAFILIVLLGASCTKTIDSKEVNPNAPASVPSDLILGTVLTDISGTGTQGTLGGIASWGEVSQWDQYFCQNYAYYGNNQYYWTGGNASWDPYLVMKNVVQMDNADTASAGKVNPYEAVGRFIEAYYYYNLTSMFGDVPQTEALDGVDNSTPTYTPQEQVFAYILNTLDTANSDLATLIAQVPTTANTLSASQDIYYGGNLSQWQKVVNSFRLRVLISLSKQSGDATLNVPAQFANIINNPTTYPIFTDTTDDLKFVYNPGGSNTYSTYPFNPSSYGSIAARYNMALTYTNVMDSLQDPRVFATCDPAWALVGSDPKPAQFKYFIGASSGEDLGAMYSAAGNDSLANVNRARYFSNFTGVPDVLVGYKEMCFNIAEAIQRGWVTGNASTWYVTGITKSMANYGISTTSSTQTAYFLPKNGTSPAQAAPYPYTFDFATWITTPAIALSTTPATAINQIVLQKYIVCFENSGYEGYYNWRRTGIPAFQGGSGVGNGGVVPLRWQYPTTEQTQNTKNYQAALTSQGFSADDENQTMWLIK
jgi:Starch-binding associating with outer membrane